ncbi:MAG: 50S ribosomal protein L29 [Candidatus Thermoplasmatota archaeon]|jgi:large subunit ribosomal protein L29|nr:50S ribosomal protein L29 [Candidatus Thermoplasmatota archaeon]
MSKEERESQLKNLEQALFKERASVAMGGSPVSPGKMKSVRRQIARVLTVMHSEDKKE